MYLFKDRKDAGEKLAAALGQYARQQDVIILALPRGGVPVAYETAKALSLPLDLCLVRKLGVPGQEELAMGAMTADGARYLNADIISSLHIPAHIIEQTVARERSELDRRNYLYRQNRAPALVQNKTVILVDDGLATGATMRAAVKSMKLLNAKTIVVAVPVGTEPICRDLAHEVDEIICLQKPEPFYGVGQWYNDFSQIEDSEVVAICRLLSEKQTLPAP